MDQKLSFITLGVKDLGVSVDFYEKKLGWKRNFCSNHLSHLIL
jgi:predicted lactoylglutathione lyase